MNESLYSMTERYNNLLPLLSDESIPDEDIEKALSEVTGDIAEKCKNGIEFLHYIDDTVANIDTRIKALTAFKKRMESRAETVKKVYMDGLAKVKMDRVSTDSGVMKIAKNPPKVVITEADKIPSEYQKQIIKIDIDKAAIKAAIKAGKTVEGARLEQGYRLAY
jgi:predicted metal-dependent peptidase